MLHWIPLTTNSVTMYTRLRMHFSSEKNLVLNNTNAKKVQLQQVPFIRSRFLPSSFWIVCQDKQI